MRPPENILILDTTLRDGEQAPGAGMTPPQKLRLAAGARQAEGCINGLGERAGNTALEEIAFIVKDNPDIYPFSLRLDLRQIAAVSAPAEELTGVPRPHSGDCRKAGFLARDGRSSGRRHQGAGNGRQKHLQRG